MIERVGMLRPVNFLCASFYHRSAVCAKQRNKFRSRSAGDKMIASAPGSSSTDGVPMVKFGREFLLRNNGDRKNTKM
jgi:hypothetical protein